MKWHLNRLPPERGYWTCDSLLKNKNKESWNHRIESQACCSHINKASYWIIKLYHLIWDDDSQWPRPYGLSSAPELVFIKRERAFFLEKIIYPRDNCSAWITKFGTTTRPEAILVPINQTLFDRLHILLLFHNLVEAFK